MNWDRFKCYCSEVLRLIEQGSSAESAFQAARTSALYLEFDQKVKDHDLQSSIIDHLQENNFSRDELIRALTIYKSIEFFDFDAKPARIRRIGVYLTLVTVAYLVTSGIYYTKVFPNFIELFDQAEVAYPEQYVWMAENWLVMNFLLVALVVATFSASKNVRKIFDFDEQFQASLVFRLIFPQRLKHCYSKVVTLTRLPLYISHDHTGGSSDALIALYRSGGFSDQDISGSLSLLIKRNYDELILHAERYIRRVYIFVAVIVLFTIYQLLSGVYSFVYAIGDMV